MQENRSSILVVEDDPGVRDYMQRVLELNEFAVTAAGSGSQALGILKDSSPDVVLLDIGLPDMTGIEVCRRLREFSQVPVIMVTALGGDDDVVDGLEAGADDYVPKPFGAQVLIARVRAVVRRGKSAPEPGGRVANGDLAIDMKTRRAVWKGGALQLTPTEFRLLAFLAQRAGTVSSPAEILTEVWGPEYADEPHILRTSIGRLRKKVEADPQQPEMILNEPGFGYLMARL